MTDKEIQISYAEEINKTIASCVQKCPSKKYNIIIALELSIAFLVYGNDPIKMMERFDEINKTLAKLIVE